MSEKPDEELGKALGVNADALVQSAQIILTLFTAVHKLDKRVKFLEEMVLSSNADDVERDA